MKTIVYTKFGPPEVLKPKSAKKPAPKENELLVRVEATTVTSGDVKSRSSEFAPVPWLLGRIMIGLTRPKRPILGMELAGEVEAVGRDVTLFRPGDRIFATTDGLNSGSYAEYLRMPEQPRSENSTLGSHVVAVRPANMTPAEAASVPVGGLTALACIRDMGRVKRGQKVLINGLRISRYFCRAACQVLWSGGLRRVQHCEY